jgi:pyruvate/2-oxoglutarate dehydrogenase complex dihydrolipoamide dehydrogenase (E3) component
MALGEDVAPDYRALPRATYTDPEAAFVGVSLEAAREAGLDAFEQVGDFTKSTRGYAIEAKFGHVTIVVDRGTRELVGAAMA